MNIFQKSVSEFNPVFVACGVVRISLKLGIVYTCVKSAGAVASNLYGVTENGFEMLGGNIVKLKELPTPPPIPLP